MTNTDIKPDETIEIKIFRGEYIESLHVHFFDKDMNWTELYVSASLGSSPQLRSLITKFCVEKNAIVQQKKEKDE